MIFKPLNVQANLKVTKCKSSPGGGGWEGKDWVGRVETPYLLCGYFTVKLSGIAGITPFLDTL